MNKYFSVPYVEGGRDLNGLDCWGLALAIRSDLGLPPLADDPLAIKGNGQAIARQFQEVAAGLERDSIKPGALAAVFKGPLFVHVGVVVEADDRLWVAETNPGVGPCMRPVADFVRAYYKVVFYCDRNLPEST